MELSFNDKLEIFDIKNIQEDFIIWKDRRILIFEYFWIFKSNIISEIIKEKWFDFQVKIKKEKFEDVKNEILGSNFLDLSELEEKKWSNFSILLNDQYREKEKYKKVQDEEIFQFLKEEKWEIYIYRHYLCINFIGNNKEDIESKIYDFLYEISDKNLIIKRLNNIELEKYLFKEINFPYSSAENIKQYSNIIKEEKKAELWFLKIIDPVFYVKKVTNLLWKIISLIDNSFFQWKAENIWWFMLDLFSQRMFKGDNFFQIWFNYKWGLIIKWIPKEDFNILYNIFYYLEKGDSVTINIYSYKKYKIEKKVLNTGVEKFLEKKDDYDENFKNKSYLQIVINFNDLNPEILDNRIKKFQLDIWTDFYTQRIVHAMSRYITTSIGTWKNTLILERAYNSERISKNLLF